MKNSFLILGFLISLLISCPPPTPGPDGNGTKKEFTVSFDANGGTGTIAPMKAKAGTEITLPDGTAFSRKYYTFDSWTNSGAGFYEAGSKYTVKADTVFFANWQRNRVSITYRSNNNAIPDKEGETDAGSDLILPGKNLFGSYPVGKHFYGWTTTAATATEADILAPGSAFPVEETALTFYAFWGTKSVTEYTVTFSGTKMKPITFNEYIKEIRLPLYTGEPGIICKGWDTDSPAETVVYEDGGIIPKADLTGNIVLYPILEDVQIKLTYIKNGAEVPPAYEDYMFPETAYYEETLQIFQLPFYKNDGTDTPWILSGIRVTETDNPSVTLTVTSGNEEEAGSYWQYTAGDKPLTVELLWKEQSISNYSFEAWDSSSGENDLGGSYLSVYCLTDIALSPGMITVTDGNDNPLTPSQKVATCVLLMQNGIRSYSCYIEFAENIPAGTYNVIFTVSGKTIHKETITVPEASETVTVPEPQP